MSLTYSACPVEREISRYMGRVDRNDRREAAILRRANELLSDPAYSLKAGDIVEAISNAPDEDLDLMCGDIKHHSTHWIGVTVQAIVAKYRAENAAAEAEHEIDQGCQHCYGTGCRHCED